MFLKTVNLEVAMKLFVSGTFCRFTSSPLNRKFCVKYDEVHFSMQILGTTIIIC